MLIRTSSSRSLALMCLYSLYSTANGERSSFCTFLWERDKQTVRKRATVRLWKTHHTKLGSQCWLLLCNLSKFLLLFTFRFVSRTGPRTLSGSCGASSSPLAPLGAAPRVPAWKRKRRKRIELLNVCYEVVEKVSSSLFK